MSDDYVRATVVFKTATPNAVLIIFDDEEYWIPRSLLSYHCDRDLANLSKGEEFEISVREWKASEIGLTY